METFLARLTQAWNAQDAAPVVALYSLDGVLVHPMAPEPLRGRDAVAAFEGAMFDGFNDISWKLLRSTANGDTVAVEYEVSATNNRPLRSPQGEIPATGRRVSIRGADVIRLDAEGRIVEAWRYQDTGAFFRQLGLA